jgi:hypothetical protein
VQRGNDGWAGGGALSCRDRGKRKARGEGGGLGRHQEEDGLCRKRVWRAEGILARLE